MELFTSKCIARYTDKDISYLNKTDTSSLIKILKKAYQ